VTTFHYQPNQQDTIYYSIHFQDCSHLFSVLSTLRHSVIYYLNCSYYVKPSLYFLNLSKNISKLLLLYDTQIKMHFQHLLHHFVCSISISNLHQLNYLSSYHFRESSYKYQSLVNQIFSHYKFEYKNMKYIFYFLFVVSLILLI
jgi:hypothetical protein